MLMPYNTRLILTDQQTKPIPQYFNPIADAYEPLYGRNGATRVELYDASGNPITVTSGKLAVRATEIESILADVWADTDNALQVRSVRRYDAIKSAPVVGVKTVTSTAAEIFAGASRLANRYAMAVYNEGSQPVYWGGSSVTTSNGFPLLLQDSIVFSFDPNVATAIYMVAASNVPVRVVELA